MCEVLDKVENRGIEKGLALGEQRFATLVSKLLADERAGDLQKATSDETFRNNLYKEYGIIC